MKALDQWISAQSRLQAAASDFLNASTALKTVTLQPDLVSRYNHEILESAVEEVQSRINSINLAESQLQESHAALNVMLNSSTSRVPIHRLPSEILGRIFDISISPPVCKRDSPEAFKLLANLQIVCSRWHRVVAGIPSFWSHIDVYLDHLTTSDTFYFIRIRLLLDRLRSVPIHLHVWGHSKLKQAVISEFLSILQPCVPLLHSIDLSGSYASRLSQALLDLYSNYGSPTTLKCLTLTTVQISDTKYGLSWPTRSLLGLVELKLSDLGLALPQLGDFVTMLTNCPTLQTLRLESLGVRSDQQEDYPLIHLPNLMLLELGSLEFGQDIVLQIIPLLHPGVHPLDITLRFYYWDSNDLKTQVQLLLARSNVTFLTLRWRYADYDTEPKSFFSYTPQLQALILDIGDLDSTGTLEELKTFVDESAECLPRLKCLCLVGGAINSEAVDEVEWAISRWKLGCLIFWSCNFRAPINSDSEGSDEEGEDRPEWLEEMPQNMREQLSPRVERLIVCDSPSGRVGRGIIISAIRELITFD